MSNGYRIVLRGHVPDRMLSPYLEEFDITRTDTTTTLMGPVLDASQLHGMVTHLTSTGLALIELTTASTADRPPTTR